MAQPPKEPGRLGLLDLLLFLLGAALLLSQALLVKTPSPVVIGAGLTVLGMIPALKLDRWIRQRRNGHA